MLKFFYMEGLPTNKDNKNETEDLTHFELDKKYYIMIKSADRKFIFPNKQGNLQTLKEAQSLVYHFTSKTTSKFKYTIINAKTGSIVGPEDFE